VDSTGAGVRRSAIGARGRSIGTAVALESRGRSIDARDDAVGAFVMLGARDGSGLITPSDSVTGAAVDGAAGALAPAAADAGASTDGTAWFCRVAR